MKWQVGEICWHQNLGFKIQLHPNQIWNAESFSKFLAAIIEILCFSVAAEECQKRNDAFQFLFSSTPRKLEIDDFFDKNNCCFLPKIISYLRSQDLGVIFTWGSDLRGGQD